MKQQKGFTLIEGLILIIMVAFIGFAGFTAMNNVDNDDNQVDNTARVEQNDTKQQEQTSEESTKISSVSCTNPSDVAATEQRAFWNEKIQNSSEIKMLTRYDPEDTVYEVQIGTECTLGDGSVLVSFSHYHNATLVDGTVALSAAKGLARFNGGEEVFVRTGSPCTNGPPDATSSAVISGVSEDIVSIVCGGYSAEEITFDLTSLTYN